ncbi:MAG: hypothetical protein A3F68_06590 [Acidobacteria bacterium RIFCSPLOWO2_12_FULL_54_10]|nr:MAG: hypothetical protein A3F68_06590 [Acidobacteria bacterium RIFCSPLOWO2_12_FULL_54_10]
MRKLVAKNGLFGMALLAISIFVAGVSSQSAETKTLEGIIGDVACGVSHKMADKTAKECTLGCVGMGSKFALIVGDKVYELDGKADELKAFAGAKAKVTGSVDGNKIQVTSVLKAG